MLFNTHLRSKLCLYIIGAFKMVFLTFPAILLISFLTGINGKSLQATFPEGSISFDKDGEKVNISSKNINISNIETLTVRHFPVKYEGGTNDICNPTRLGEILQVECLTTNTTKCTVGNLTVKLPDIQSGSKAIFDGVSTTGHNSIFGRSLLIEYKNNVVQCANIEPVGSVLSAVGIFRAISPGIAGTVDFRQGDSVTVIDVSLMLVDARSSSKRNLMLTIHENPPQANGSCVNLGQVYNPHGVTACDKRNPKTCPIGDLFAKVGPVTAILPGAGSPRSLHVDTNLPLSGKNSIIGRSLVISENGRKLMCTKIQEYQTLVGRVDLRDSKGSPRMVEFTQGSIYEPVMINMSRGLSVDMKPGSLDGVCEGNGEWLNLTASGKVPGITLYGFNSILFRSILVNKVCSTVKPKNPTFNVKAMANFSSIQQPVTGMIEFHQVVFNKSKAFSSICSITVDVKNKNSSITSDHNWHVHQLAIYGKNLTEMLKNVQGHYNPYNVYVTGNDYEETCDSSFPFRCEVGDLSNKLGTYTVGSGRKQYTESENYLASWHNVLGRSIVIHHANKGAGRLACADLHAKQGSFSLQVKNSSKTRNKVAFQKTVSKVLSASEWQVATIKFKVIRAGCLEYTFTLIDDYKSDLHKMLTNIVKDHPEKLKDFAPGCESSHGWKIDEGHIDEILSVVFGFIALMILVIAITFWIKKKNKDIELESKLVTVDGKTETTELNTVPLNAIEEQPNDKEQNGERRDSTNDYKTTTSL